MATKQTKNQIGEKMNKKIKQAIERKSVDLIDGVLYLANGQQVSRAAASVLLKRRKEEYTENCKRLARLIRLDRNAGLKEVREAEGIGDSRSVSKEEAIAKVRKMMNGYSQYADDVWSVVEFMENNAAKSMRHFLDNQ